MKIIFFSLLFFAGQLNAQTKQDITKAFIQKIPNSSVNFTMQPIPGGSFVMGSTSTDKDAKANEQPSKKNKDQPLLDGQI